MQEMKRYDKIWRCDLQWTFWSYAQWQWPAVMLTFCFCHSFHRKHPNWVFTELSSHLSILFLCSISSVQDGQAGNNVLRLRLDQSITVNTPHYLRMTLGKPKGTSGGDGCTERGWTMRRVPTKKLPRKIHKSDEILWEGGELCQVQDGVPILFRLFSYFFLLSRK